MNFTMWLENTALAVAVREGAWEYPLLLCLHAIGLGALVGLSAVIDLRLLGFARRLPVAPLLRLFPLIWGGLVLNAVSGLALFSSDAHRFLSSTNFQIKLLVIALGAGNTWLLQRHLSHSVLATDDAAAVSSQTRLLAASSLALWMSAIVAGRLLAYTTIPA
jgi:hypothetical protein